ncbi:sulfur carrier protein ThiS [Emcibacter nanhaiensis]|uniref:Sulfur carrier protein ThiS n=1 Tax=Emcibacter nanhaiensis TaxID=1505037 RepID=A0A501PS79_9PROT|nr:sulfur carrier protein ThiS [Emcibacter nanhaiensis]TPD63095.1 sulfur carrier protein ThiS [Emcibacter nanhaiensis]
MISLMINGDEHTLEKQMSLHDLLEELDIDPSKVAVERNLEIVPKTTFQQVLIEDGDQLEIVHFIGGGKID